MKLIEALEIINRDSGRSAPKTVVHLACGMTPLHFQTLLHAHLKLALPDQKIELRSGLFGDLAGNLERLKHEEAMMIAAPVEWSDLDPRLGLRVLGGWEPDKFGSILEHARLQGERILRALRGLAGRATVAVCPPTLPLSPIAYTPGWQLSEFEAALQEQAASWAARTCQVSGVRVVSLHTLDRVSPPGSRLDARSALETGFPYTLAHADYLAELFSRTLADRTPMKGLITDLDDTLWKGILGEVGIEAVGWDLDHHAQLHGLYQQFLAALAETGVLIGVATKNDPKLVEEAFRTRRPVLAWNRLFPVEAGWGPKSESVARILRAWNVGADSVAYIDDSALDLAEVKAAHPEVSCLRFPCGDTGRVLNLLEKLRDLFGKRTVSKEDRIRLESIRASQTAAQQLAASPAGPEDFLSQACAKMSLVFQKDPADPRAFELINKTNQFNLNGRRLSEASWKSYLEDPGVFVAVASYEDKFGPLGKIAVAVGRKDGRRLRVEHWVMSCRAFSRRIEHAMLVRLFERLEAEEALFNFLPTPRNGPLQEFLVSFLGQPLPSSPLLNRDQFQRKCPAIYIQTEEIV